jgi:hypothetical protein
MQSTTQTAPVSKARVWTGRIISGLVVVFLVFDSARLSLCGVSTREPFGPTERSALCN